MSARTVPQAEPYTGEYSKERSLERLGPELMAHIEACVDAAPPPSAEMIAALRRAFAITQPAS